MKRVKQANGRGELVQVEQGDPPLNPYGRPKKLVSQVLADLREAGAQPVSPGQVSDVISVLLNLPVDMVKKIATDPNVPILIQRTARRFAGSSDKDWDWVLSNNLDRAHGKAISRHEIGGKDGGAIKMDFSKLSTEELREMAKLRKKAIANGDSERSPSNGK